MLSRFIWFCLNPYTIAINLLLNFLVVKKAVDAVKKVIPKTKEDFERDEKFAAFKRNDLEAIHGWKLYLLMPTIVLRWCVAWLFYIPIYIGAKWFGLFKTHD